MKKLSKLYQTILNKQLYAAILIGIVCLSTHGVTLLNDYNLDDNLVTQNHRLTSKGISAIPEIYQSPYYLDDMGYSYGYRPTTLASFAIEKSLFGESATVSHAVNLALYLATCLLIFFLIKRVFHDKIDVALFAALLFTVHPIHTEVVASIKNRDEILALLFALTGCFVLVRPKRWWVNALVASALFFLSVSSKMSAVNIILLLALIPSYPKPFFKDIVVLALYSLAIYFVFEGRDVLNDNSARNVLALVFLYFILRLTSSSGVKVKKVTPTLTSFIRLTKSVWNEIKKKSFLSVQYSALEKIQIIVGSFVTYWMVVYDDLVSPQKNFILTTVIGSFLVLPTNKPDIFLRLSIIPLVFEIEFGFRIFLFLGFIFRLYSGSHKKYVLKSLVILAIGTGLEYYWLADDENLFEDMVKNVAFVLALFAISYYRKFQLKWTLITLFFIGVISVVDQEYLVYAMAVFFSLVTTGIVARSKSDFSFSTEQIELSFKKKSIALRNLLTAVVYISLSVLIANTFLAEKTYYELISESTNEIKNSLLQNKSTPRILCSEPLHEIAEPWSQNQVLSWKRPFDFVEHPLSPFASPNLKYGTAAITLNTYLGKLIVPYPLAFYYGYDEITIDNLFSPWSLFSILIHLFIVFIAFHYRKTNFILSVGIFLYLTSIILFSGAVEIVAGMFADRFSYTASFGFCIALAAGFKLVINKLNHPAQVSFVTLGMVLLISFSSYSFQRNKLWKNKLILMRHDIDAVPNSAQAHNLLAHALMENAFSDGYLSATEKSGKVSEAAFHFERATEIYPQFFNAWVDLGRVNIEINEPQKAISAFEKALAEDSTYTPILGNLAVLNEQLGRKDRAIFYYRKHIKIGLAPFEVYDALARILYDLGRYEESIIVCEQYLKIAPSNTDFQRNISMMQEFLDSTPSEKTNLSN